jgi:hypothetical protein
MIPTVVTTPYLEDLIEVSIRPRTPLGVLGLTLID